LFTFGTLYFSHFFYRMNNYVAIVFFFTLIIHLIATLAYSVRLVGIQTGRLAVSFALFNILVLVSRFSNSIQAPILAKWIEKDMSTGNIAAVGSNFHWLILAATIGTLLGAFLIPTFQRIFISIVKKFNTQRSVPKLLIHGFSKAGVKRIKEDFTVPTKQNIKHFKDLQKIPRKLLLLNMLVVGILTVGSFSAIYAGLMNPDLRLTSGYLAPVITGFATISLVVLIDPFFSLMTDDVIEGKCSESYFRKCVAFMVGSRFMGTLLAQLFLFPAAKIIVFIAKLI